MYHPFVHYPSVRSPIARLSNIFWCIRDVTWLFSCSCCARDVLGGARSCCVFAMCVRGVCDDAFVVCDLLVLMVCWWRDRVVCTVLVFVVCSCSWFSYYCEIWNLKYCIGITVLGFPVVSYINITRKEPLIDINPNSSRRSTSDRTGSDSRVWRSTHISYKVHLVRCVFDHKVP